MWNIYRAFELVYPERWKRLPNLGFKNERRKKKKSTMVVKGKTHALVSLLFGLNYTADPGKICVWIKNRLDRKHWWDNWPHVFSRALQQPLRFQSLSLLKSPLAEKEEKHSRAPKMQVCRVLFLPSKGLGHLFLKYRNPFCGSNHFSCRLTNIYFLVSNIFCLGVGLCHLLLFVSALNTLVARGASPTGV